MHPPINLFATKANAILPFCMSPVPDLMFWKEDTFQHNWDDLNVYALPPFTLLRQILLRVLISWNFSMILIAPLWPQKEWFAYHLSLLRLPSFRAAEPTGSTSHSKVS